MEPVLGMSSQEGQLENTAGTESINNNSKSTDNLDQKYPLSPSGEQSELPLVSERLRMLGPSVVPQYKELR